MWAHVRQNIVWHATPRTQLTISVGISPLMKLCFRFKYCKRVSKANSVGIVPLKLLFCNEILYTWNTSLHSMPYKLLLHTWVGSEIDVKSQLSGDHASPPVVSYNNVKISSWSIVVGALLVDGELLVLGAGVDITKDLTRVDCSTMISSEASSEDIMGIECLLCYSCKCSTSNKVEGLNLWSMNQSCENPLKVFGCK